eukprot:2143425-Alexandrium_andersonii.AAC.1
MLLGATPAPRSQCRQSSGSISGRSTSRRPSPAADAGSCAGHRRSAGGDGARGEALSLPAV